MGILHRVYARNAPEVWETETRLLHALRLVRRPVAAQWVVTSACDMHCPHCYSRAGKRAVGELSTAEAKRLVIDELVAMGKPLLVLAGGELLLRRDIPELVEYACGKGLSWSMHTHGLHVPRFRELFKKFPPVLAAISLDGDREKHDAFRGKKGSFDGALEAMQVLRECGCPEIVAGTTVTRDNADHVAELFPVVTASAATSWGLHLFAPEGRGADFAELMPTADQLRRVAEFARQARALFHVELCNEWGGAGDDDALYRDRPFLCGAGRISFVVSSQGEVLPCTTTDLDESEGNVRDRPLRDIWRNGFGRFRGAGHGACSEGRECWLQSRNGVSCSEAAFGPAALRRPGVADLVPSEPLRPGDARVLPERGAGLVRATAVAAVFLGACATKAKNAAESLVTPTPSAGAPSASGGSSGLPDPSVSPGSPRPEASPAASGEFPNLDPDALSQHFALASQGGPWLTLLRGLQAAPGAAPDWAALREQAMRLRRALALSQALVAHIDERAQGKAVGVAQLTALLDAAEEAATFEVALGAYLWRLSRDLPDSAGEAEVQARRALFLRIARHIRAAEALRKAAERGPLEFEAWRSKAAPPAGVTSRAIITKPFLDELRRAYQASSAEGWASAPKIALTIKSGSVELWRGGARLPASGQVELRRLDTLRATKAATLVHPRLGEIALPEGSEVTLHSLGRRLSPEARAKVEGWVAAAGKGDDEATRALESVVGVAAEFIIGALSSGEQAPMRGRLLMILARAND